MVRDALRRLLRGRVRVSFEDATRTAPVSRLFGLDRGTPIDRYYIEQFLEAHASRIRGRVLEVAGSEYSRRFGADRVDRYEVLNATPGNADATIVGDLSDASTLPAGVADCFICTQTFNFIFEVRRAVEGAHHLLKPGGVLLATMAGLCQISRYDMERWGDYWRFTTASAERLFGEVFGPEVEVSAHGNLLAAKALLDGLAVEDLPHRDLLDAADQDYQVVITVVARKRE